MLYLCTVSMLAQIRGNEIRVVVSPDHSNWTYGLKEKCSFTVRVYKAQNMLPDVRVDYELGPEWYKIYEGMATAAYTPEAITAHAVNPADFDNFWQQTLNQARQIPLAQTMELLTERCTENVNVYQVSFQNIRNNSRTYGILCVPKAPGK